MDRLSASARLKSAETLAKVAESKEEYRALPRRKKKFRLRRGFTFSDKFEDSLGRRGRPMFIFQNESEDSRERGLWSVCPIQEVPS